MDKWETEICMCRESLVRGGMTKSQARAYNFCGNSIIGFCSLWNECHGQKKPAPLLRWYRAQVRIRWQWETYDILAYTEAQAKKLLRDMVGYHISLGPEDYRMQFVRELTQAQTEAYGSCKIQKKV